MAPGASFLPQARHGSKRDVKRSNPVGRVPAPPMPAYLSVPLVPARPQKCIRLPWSKPASNLQYQRKWTLS